VTGSGRSVAVAGSAATFEVVLQDEYGNRCSVARSADLVGNAQEDRTGAADRTTAQGATRATALAGGRRMKQLCLKTEQMRHLEMMPVQVITNSLVHRHASSSPSWAHKASSAGPFVANRRYIRVFFLILLTEVRYLLLFHCLIDPCHCQ
jgi:hypothetical protein